MASAADCRGDPVSAARGSAVADAATVLSAGLDGAALSTLEAGTRPDPTVETLARYAEAVGKRLVVSLADA